ncbi:MFS general substrate transporter [Mytilinidion resinicola]|uniref:MFS general substrate transporter n=1 Tax=Mytilinidion resinicola TaxID=574789 RepID=A0A6A6Z213_9PEZI|nr:MFS general substrate transporter [Mytilinidion resinicola]KAF2815040.1 MFS general substrate transporter [Mytilinidion resinicola]
MLFFARDREYDLKTVQPGSTSVYERKVAVVNRAMLDLGMGKYQWMVFGLSGLGWFMDVYWKQSINLIGPFVRMEFGIQQIAFLNVAKQAGSLIGAIFWPLTSDYIGRRPAFNITLALSCVTALVAAGSPSFAAIAILAGVIGFAIGGNQYVDSTIFIEFVPASHQFLLPMATVFATLAQLMSVLIAWPLVTNYSCTPRLVAAHQCNFMNNLGWRYYLWTGGGLSIPMVIARYLFHLLETPKYLLGRSRDAAAVSVVQTIASTNRNATWLTLDSLRAIDAELYNTTTPRNTSPTTPTSSTRTLKHRLSPHKLPALFCTPKMALSTTLVLFIWSTVGFGYTLFNSFLPFYLQSQSSHPLSTQTLFRTLAIQAACGIPGSVLAGYAAELPRFGRKGTGCVACLGSAVFLFLFTRAQSDEAVLGYSCAVAFCIAVAHGLLYGYTSELFPAPIRGTGQGVVGLASEAASLGAALVAAWVGLGERSVWVAAGCLTGAGCAFLGMPYEMRGRAAA